MDSTAQAVQLQPALAHTTGQSIALSTAFAPNSNLIALVPSPLETQLTPSTTQQRQLVYAAQFAVDHSHRREFIVHSYTLFASLQKIAQDGTTDIYGAPSQPTQDQLSYYNRIIRLYQDALVQQLPIIQADTTLSPSLKSHQLTHHADLHSILSLTQLLYLPNDGRGDGLVGEELLDWVNTVDRAPSAEEGEELADLSRPWEHPNFWPYLHRCILRAHLLSSSTLLSLLASSHPSPILRDLATLATDLLNTFPRSTAFRTEAEFLHKLRIWKAEANKSEKRAEELFAAAEEDEVLGADDDLRLDFETSFRCLFELLNGSESRVLEVAEDWREALGAWGVWVNPGGRREGVPATLQLITKSHPVDSTLPSEAVQSSLILGDVPRALQQSNLLSTWLVAHLSDLLYHLGVLDSPPPSSSSSNSYSTDLRTHFLLSYTDLLQSDPTLWRVTVDYLAACGEEGRARMRGVLKGVELSSEAAERVGEVEKSGAEEQGMDVEGASEKENADPEQREKENRQPSVVEEVLRVCSEQGLEEEMMSVCKVWSEQLIAQKRYGEAVSFCVRAGDSKRIARIADRVLEEYVVHGQESFIAHVDSIPTSLLRPPSSSLHRDLFGASSDDLTSASRASSPMGSDEGAGLQAPFSSRLSFLARYRDFFAFYARGDRRQAAGLLVLLLTSGVAPKGFYAVMLLDVLPLLSAPTTLDSLLITPSETYELLRILEELTSPISATGVDIYGHLDSLARLLGGGEEETGEMRTKRALRQLEVVRGELARHLGRCCCL
ncbi:Nup85 nucleoporin-domain-containing protein [Leucosporidium creatinivorum]|uniref:Nuclear pore complex protein Nup85 n=1 Tax=Leucosporidium creatinivorum TaxID=106004 RepID=A0A1Y2ECW0_9BASI|nr:Nup85 nucleoporin-domain-containing protein [Leucosporidium creatinivorum]